METQRTPWIPVPSLGKHTRIVLVLCALSFLGVFTTDAPVAAQPQFPTVSTHQLQIIAADVRRESQLPGVVIGIQHGNTPAVFAASGMADSEQQIPLHADAPFFIGSISKNFFATILLLLAEEEALALDDPLSQFIDWPSGKTITLTMLLNHTSGIPDYYRKVFFSGTESETIRNFHQRWTVQELLASVQDDALLFMPGTQQQYSNTNGLLVGVVIERVTGQSLATVLQERICRPLNLHHTYLYGQAAHSPFPVNGYHGEPMWGTPNAAGLVNCTFADLAINDAADGTIVSTAGDLLTYHRALRAGQLVSAPSWRLMRQQTPGFHNGLAYLLLQSQYGQLHGNVGRTIGHQSAGVYHEETDSYFVVLTNRGDGSTPLANVLEKIMVNE